MHICSKKLKKLGFQRTSRTGLWVCEQGFGLDDDQHITLDEDILKEGRRTQNFAVPIEAFHVTSEFFSENVHVYYREISPFDQNKIMENIISHCLWEREGHTPSQKIKGLGLKPQKILTEADEIAEDFLREIGSILYSDQTDVY